VRIEIDVVARRPEAQSSPWESIGTFKLDVSSGEVRLWGPELLELDQSARVQVPIGSYAGEAFSRDTDQLVDEQATDGPDRYRLVLWPATVRP
jgi:hypothetical protein